MDDSTPRQRLQQALEASAVVAISLLVLLNLHLKLRAQMELITVLARQLAITGAARPLEIGADAPSLQPGKVQPV